MPKGIYKRTEKHLAPLIQRNKSLKNRRIVSKALMGHGFSKETLEKMSKNHKYQDGEANPNWQGENVRIGGIHLWLANNFKKTCICSFCGKKGNTFSIQWAKIKDKEYQRKRENFIELCTKCHANYDRNKDYCINGHKQIPINLYNMKSGARRCKLCIKLYRKKK